MKEIKIKNMYGLCAYISDNTLCDENCNYCLLEKDEVLELNIEGVIKECEEIEVTQYYKLLPNGKMITWIIETGMEEEPAPSSLTESWDKLGNHLYATAMYKNKRQYKINEKDVKLNVAWEIGLIKGE